MWAFLVLRSEKKNLNQYFRIAIFILLVLLNLVYEFVENLRFLLYFPNPREEKKIASVFYEVGGMSITVIVCMNLTCRYFSNHEGRIMYFFFLYTLLLSIYQA